MLKDENRSVTTARYPAPGYNTYYFIEFKYALVKLGAQDAYFSITGEVASKRWPDSWRAGGCLHSELSKVALVGHDALLPEMLKWHLVGVRKGPMHYEANSVYHFDKGAMDLFRLSCVFGAVEGDTMPSSSTALLPFLRARKEALMANFEADMVRLFGEIVREVSPC